MDNIYRYNYFFIVTEDNIIRNKFINEFDNKIKYLLPNKIISFNKFINFLLFKEL